MSFAQSLTKSLGKIPYTPSSIKDLKRRRAQSSLGLGIDCLLSYAGISNPNNIYPPNNRDSMLKLVSDIESAGKKSIHQARALLYLFLDFAPVGEKNKVSGVAEYFCSQTWVSQPEQDLVAGLWLLDHGKAQESLELLGQPWDFEGADLLNNYIVEALTLQRIGAVACYLAARSSSGLFNDHLVRSLALRGKFAEVLDIARTKNRKDYLKEITCVAIENKQNAKELAQLPCTPEEWDVIREELYHIIRSASPSQKEVNATIAIARDILLVRALHTGDMETLVDLKGSSDHADLFIQNFEFKA